MRYAAGHNIRQPAGACQPVPASNGYNGNVQYLFRLQHDAVLQSTTRTQLIVEGRNGGNARIDFSRYVIVLYLCRILIVGYIRTYSAACFIECASLHPIKGINVDSTMAMQCMHSTSLQGSNHSRINIFI